MKELSELSAPAAIERKPLLEREIQKQCVDWMRARGYWARKFSSQSQRSVPDYLFAKRELTWNLNFNMAHNVKLATEFKREDCKPKLIKKYGVTVMSTEAQYDEQLAMQAAGWYTFECNDFYVFQQTVLDYERSLLC
jgi:hypothetical protein